MNGISHFRRFASLFESFIVMLKSRSGAGSEIGLSFHVAYTLPVVVLGRGRDSPKIHTRKWIFIASSIEKASQRAVCPCVKLRN